MTQTDVASAPDACVAAENGSANGGAHATGRIVRVSSEAALRDLYAFRYRVFVVELGWMPQDREDIPGHVRTVDGVRLLTDRFDEVACNFAAYDDEGEVVGSVRVVRDGALGLPLERCFPLEEYRPARTVAEVCRLAVAPDYRRGSLAARLMRMACQYSMASGVTHIVVDTFVGDGGPARMYEWIGFRRIGGPYEDGVHEGCDLPSYALALDVEEACAEARSARPTVYRFFTDVQEETLEALRHAPEQR